MQQNIKEYFQAAAATSGLTTGMILLLHQFVSPEYFAVAAMTAIVTGATRIMTVDSISALENGVFDKWLLKGAGGDSGRVVFYKTHPHNGPGADLTL